MNRRTVLIGTSAIGIAAFAGGALVLTIVSALGILLMYLVRGYRQRTATGVDVAIAAAGFSHTIPRPESA